MAEATETQQSGGQSAQDPSLQNPNSIDRAKTASIAEAWKAAQDEVGPVDENVPEGEADPEKAKDPSAKKEPAKKAAAKEEPAEDEGEDEAKEVTSRDYTTALRKLKERFGRKEQSLSRAYGEREQKIQAAVQRFSPLAEACDHLDSGDLDSFAEAVGKFLKNDAIKDWNTLQHEGIQASQTPVYREVRKLKQEQAEARRQASAQQQRAQQEQAQRAQQERYQAHKGGVESDLSEDEDAALAELTDLEPSVVDHIISEQERHYHEHDGEALDTRAAASKVLGSLYARVTKWAEFFDTHKDSPLVKQITGSRANPKKPAPVAGAPRASARQQKGGKPPPSVSHTRAAEASATERMSDAELKRFWARKMEEASQGEESALTG